MTQDDYVGDLLAFIGASPTPFHAAREVARRLEVSGYTRLDEKEAWRIEPGARAYVVRGDATIAAFHVGTCPPSDAGFRLVGAHTDSPNLRVKPNPELTRNGCHQLGVEVYGGVLLSTWLDRDLSIAGRVLVRGAGGTVDRHMVDFRRAVCRIPSLAIHLNRQVNTEGLVLNPQQHLVPINGLSASGPFSARQALADELLGQNTHVAAEDVLAWDLSLYDVEPPARAGFRDELVAAPRLDDLASCHAATRALTETAATCAATRGILLYDHEECGSRSAHGADSPFMRTVLERLTSAWPALGADALARAAARSFFISVDMAHAVHPNYADSHEPAHQPILGGGPVIKSNVNQSYATDGESSAYFESLCRDVGVTPQRFVTRTDLGCGTTIGPITAAQMGIRAVDVGSPMLAMHSARETCAAADVGTMLAVLRGFFDAAR